MTKSCLFFSLLISVTTLSSVRLFASPQIPDYVIYKSDTIVTYKLLVEQYLQNQEIVQSEKLFGLSFRDGATTNCWRGYQAIYRIDNDSLFLVDIIDCGERRRGKIDTAASAKKIKIIFKNKVVNGKVYIDWFSGDISFPVTTLKNNILRWDGVFYTIYEKETVVNISNGKILKVENVENYEDKSKALDRRDKSKVSDILLKQLQKLKWKKIDDLCAENYIVTIGENGKISKVSMREYQSPDTIEKYWDKWEYDSCIDAIYKALQTLRFDILKDKGKPIAEDIYIEIWYDSKKRKIEKAP